MSLPELKLEHTTRNQRTSTRIHHKMRVLFKPKGRGGNIDGATANISKGGLYLYALAFLTARTDVLLYLQLNFGAQEKLCIVRGTILRVDTLVRSKGVGYGYGIALDASHDGNAMKAIETFVDSMAENRTPF